MSYNGWENYETWCVNLWLSNEEGLYTETRDMAYNYLPPDDEEEAEEYDKDEAINNFADEICLNVRAMAPEVKGLFSDLLTRSLNQVNWQEIALSWLNEAIEEN